MKLIYKHNQEHHFKIFTYPDGQQNVELDLNYFNNVKEPVDVIASIRNFSELEIFLCLVAALKRHDFTIKHINFKYLFGMRSDRSFASGQPNYFRDVLAPIINSLNCPVSILYPHSELAVRALNKYNLTIDKVCEHYSYSDCYNIGADQNAEWSNLYNLIEIPHFLKKRTPDGIDIYLPADTAHKIKELPEHIPLLIKDDLCDGGATFIAIAEYLQMHFPERKRYLFVAHGLFTKGINHVSQHWDKVITTNSYQDFLCVGKENLEVIDVWN